MAISLNFDEGIKEYIINGDETRVIRVNTADYGLITRFNDARKHINDMAQKYERFNLKPDGSPAEENDEEATEALKEMGEFIKNEVNFIFGADISDAVFGTAHPMSTCKGKPLYERFFDCVMPVINADIESEAKQAKAVVDKYKKQAQKVTKVRK